jgi:hypothetical protein
MRYDRIKLPARQHKNIKMSFIQLSSYRVFDERYFLKDEFVLPFRQKFSLVQSP